MTEVNNPMNKSSSEGKSNGYGIGIQGSEVNAAKTLFQSLFTEIEENEKVR